MSGEVGNNNGRQSAGSLLKGELRSYCRSEPLSEEGLRQLIERHGLIPNNTNISNDYEFFRAACLNERVTEGIIRCLLEYFPDAAGFIDINGWTPLHASCFNSNVTLDIIQLLIDAAPDSVRSVCNDGCMPLHNLCCSKKMMDDAVAMKILKLLIEKHPEAVWNADNNGCLPIHYAAGTKSPEFCRVLLEVYPGSEQVHASNGPLPLHHACFTNTVATVEYLLKLYPAGINIATTGGFYPIHYAIEGIIHRGNTAAAIDIVRFLLDCDPNQKLKQRDGMSLLGYACRGEYNDSNIEAGIQIIKILFDAHPKAIENNRIVADIQGFHHQVQTFINGESVYAREAKDLRLMTTPDDHGQLPLHRALQNNVRLGSIKLLVKGFSSAIRNADNNFAMPLHIACEHHDSASVVEYLLDLDTRTLRATDIDNNTALHYACRGAKHDTIAMLLEKYDAASVSKRNGHGKLPIDLLWESNEVSDRESLKYTESVFQLLRAYPEMVTSSNVAM
eukprot:scaffold518_cov105-Skeletonema_menzelii.AAC.8